MQNNKDQKEDNNSENVEESLSDEENENGVYPLINLNISMNNGQKKSLAIYENDNIEQKVKDFCTTYRISPNDQEVLLQRVKEELDTKSSYSKTGTFKNDNLSSTKSIKGPKDSQRLSNIFLDYVPKEKNRLEHILNESDSISLSESLKQSNNLDNLIREYKNGDDDAEKEKDKTLEKNNIIEQASNPNTIKKDLNKSVNPIINNNLNNSKQPTLLNNENLINSAKNNNNNVNNINNNANNIIKPAIIQPAYSNLNNNINNNVNLNAITKNDIYKYNSYYKNKNNQLVYNNSGLNKIQVNNTYQNLSNANSNILPLNNSNFTQANSNYTGLISPRVEFIDTYNSQIDNNSNIILSPQPQPKTIIYNTTPSENYVKYTQVETPKLEAIPTYNTTVTYQTNIEPCNYAYKTKEISNAQTSPNTYTLDTNGIYTQNNNVNKNESIAFNYNINQSQHTDLNNINSNIVTDINDPQNVNINYDNLNNQNNTNYDLISNQNTQTDKYDTVNQTEYTTYENMNFQTYNSNIDQENNQILDYNNKESVNSPNLGIEFKKYDETNNQIVEYENSPNIYSNKNSQYQIYESVQSQKSLMNNNNINNDLNAQNKRKSDKNKKVKVLKVEKFNSDIIQNKNNSSIQLNDINNINENRVNSTNSNIKNLNIKENPYLNDYINMNENIINNNNLKPLNDNLNKTPSLIKTQTNNINNSNTNIKNVAYNHKINNNLKKIEIPQNKIYSNDTNEISQHSRILTNEIPDTERSQKNKETNTTIEIESDNNKNMYLSPRNNKSNNMKQIIEKKSASNEEEMKNSVHPLDSSSRKNEQNKYNEINSLYDSNMIEEDISNEMKKSNKKSISNSNKNENNMKKNEKNEKKEDNIEEKEPQDNRRKKKRADLPRDTDENLTQTQYDNISDNSKNNRSNLSNHEGNISKINISEINNSKNNISKSKISNNNNINENENENEINKSKNSNNKNSSKISENNNNKNNTYNNSYNKIINDEDINNSINNNKNKQKSNDIKELFDNLSQNDKKEENNKSNKKSSNIIININKDNSSYNGSENINESSIENENFENYLDKELGNKKPKYKKTINLENSVNSSQQQSLQNSQINQKYSKNTYQQNNNNRKKPMKVLTFKNNEFISNNINKRSNSSGANRNRCNMSKNNLSGKRLYDEYKNQLKRKEQLKKRILEERQQEENRNISPTPRIDPNSRRIVEKMRNNQRENKIEERLINYGYNKKQKHLIEKANNDIKNKIISPFKPKIDKKSRSIANKNKKNRICKSIDIIEEKKRRINYKRIDLNKEFGKRNRSIGNEHSKKNGFINFEEPKNIKYRNNSNLSRNNKNLYKKNSNNLNENNYNLNSYRNSKNENSSLTDENKTTTTLSQLNKTLELNKAYKELYNSIDEKNDSDIAKYFGNYGTDLNSNLTENNIHSHSRFNSKDNKNASKEKRSLTPPVYSTFDYLYYESEQQDEKIRKKQELHFKRYYPFKPRISPYAKQLKIKKKESTTQFINRISKNLEEIKKVNKSKTNMNDKEKNTFRPKVSRGPKNPNQRNVTVNLDGFYDKRITKEKNELQKKKNEDNKEKKNLYNQKSKDLIMKMKIQKYKEIFNLLDSNKDGFISNSEIQLTKIDERLLKNISPLLEELNKTKKRMNFKEFCIKIDKIMIEKKLEKNK